MNLRQRRDGTNSARTRLGAARYPEARWVDSDPANNYVASDHGWIGGVIIATCARLHGVLPDGARHTLEVGVDVMPME